MAPQLIFTLRPGEEGWDFTGVNDYLDGCAIYDECYGVSGSCGTGELGGFQKNSSDKQLSIGTFNSSLFVQNRVAQWLMATSNMEYMIVDVITGDDYNGGERPNNTGESLYIKCVTGGDNSPTKLANSGKDGGYSFPDVDANGAWTTKTVNIPPSNRGNFLWQIYAAAGSPEFQGQGGVFANNQNAGDRFAVDRIRIYGEVPTHIQYFRVNGNSPDTDIYAGDPVVFSWSTKLGSFAGATSGEIRTWPGNNLLYSIPSGDLLEGQWTLNPGPSSEQQYRLVVQGQTGEGTQDVTVMMITPDSDPDSFSFDNVEGAELSTSYTSNTVTITGLETTVQLNATNGAETRKNNGSFNTNTKNINNDDTVTVRMTSSANYGTPKTTTVNVGSASNSWKITTKTEPAQLPNEFSFDTVDPAPLESIVESNVVTITGITQPVEVSAVNAVGLFESRVKAGSWGPWSSDVKTISSGQQLQLRTTTSNVLGETKSTGITVGSSGSEGWTVINTTDSDSNPDYFDFVDVPAAPANTPTDSDTLTITGLTVPATVTSTNGALLSVNGGPFAPSPSQISNNQTLQIRLTSSPDPGGEVETSITIGNNAQSELTDVWKVFTTTAGDIEPDDFYFIDKDKQVPGTMVESNTVIIQGITSPSPIVISGGEGFIGNGPNWITNGLINNGETLKLRIQASAQLDTPVSLSVTIG